MVSKETAFGATLLEVPVPPSALYVIAVPVGRTGAGEAAVEAVYDCPPVETFFTQTAPVDAVP